MKETGNHVLGDSKRTAESTTDKPSVKQVGPAGFQFKA